MDSASNPLALQKVKLLHQVVTKNYLDLDKLLSAYVTVGKDLFGLEVGIASKVQGDQYTVVAVSENSFGIEAGALFELQDTYCREVVKFQKTIHVHHAGTTEPYKSHPVYENLKLESYISAPVYVDGKIFGTINFSSTKVKEGPFDEFDQDLIGLMANSIGSFVEMKNAQEQSDKHREQAHLSSRLESLGQMAGGIAHEINNPLAIIGMSSANIRAVLESDPKNTDKLCEHLDTINATVERVSKIIGSLQSIARDSSEDPLKEELVGEIVENAYSICREKLKNGEVKFNIEGDLKVKLPCRGGEVSQVLLNLISNAYDAVRDTNEKWIKLQIVESAEALVLSVSDSGWGIPSDVRARMMDPFYTTKSVGKGTGLGLSISRKIMEMHGGQLLLDEKSKNTKIDMVFQKPQTLKLAS